MNTTIPVEAALKNEEGEIIIIKIGFIDDRPRL